MPKLKKRVYSRYSRKAAALIGNIIQLSRKEQKLTAQDLADRANISRTTLQKIEKGDMGCEIGLVFEVATLVGVKLFGMDAPSLDLWEERTKDKISLLPLSTRTPKRPIDDDF